MTREEARIILLRYRPGTPDADEPEIAAALALAGQDVDLSRWLEQHCAQQEILRAKIRQIPVPAGLKEQIISERVVYHEKLFRRRALVVAGVSAIVIFLGWQAINLWQTPPRDDTFSNYRSRMTSTALRGYAMDFESGDLAQIRAFFTRQKTPADYELPAGLQKYAATGCAIEHWQQANVAMICFRTGRPLPPGGKNDLWLFVVDRGSVKDAPGDGPPQISQVNKLTTASWTRGNKLYVLGVIGDERMLRECL